MNKQKSFLFMVFIVLFTPYHQVNGTSPIYEVGKVSFRGSIIRIFTDARVRNAGRFFFEPLVQLDPKSIFSHHHRVIQLDVVSFTIEMWNNELRRKVLTRVKSLYDQQFNMTNIGEEDVYVLPFEEVLLNHNFNITNPAVKVDNQSKSYVRKNEKLQFYMLCNSTITANRMAEDFRNNTEFVLFKWNMTLSGHGLELGKEVMYTYPVSTYS